MSSAMSHTVRFEDHFGPKVPGSTPSGDHAPRAALLSAGKGARLRALVVRMRRSVVQATEATELAVKIEWWETYREARTEAIAMLEARTDTSTTPPLRRL
jgi:hypothetical protein